MAREAMNRPDAQGFSWESLNVEYDGIDAIKVGVCDPVPTITKGPRAGQPNWRLATNRTYRIIPMADYYAFEDAWVALGNCRTCSNRRELLVSWNHITGSVTKPCPDCSGDEVVVVAGQLAMTVTP